MKSSTKLLLCALLALAAGRARGQDDQAITGYVSRAVSTSDFDVNGLRVLCTGKTRGVPKPAQKPAKGAKVAIVPCPGDAPWVGEGMAVHYTGVVDDNRIVATWIDRHSAPRLGEVSGSAVIDAPPAHEAAGLTVRADGYRIHIAGETKSDFTAPLKSLADVNAGDWIKYKGKLTPAGLVEAASVEIGPNTIGDSEEKLREKSEFDAGAAPTITKRDHLKNALTLSYDPRQFPRFKDDVMQARVEEIGDSLVPAYQRALPNSDPAKINFRFQVVDNKHFCNLLACETYAMPSGIIQVPHQIVERIQNDSQLAAVLADGIASVLERQVYRYEGKIRTAYVSSAAAVFVPYVNFGASAGYQTAEEMQLREQQQRDRVSLWMMQIAGFDIDQAPMAWWVLSLDPKSLGAMGTLEVPDRTAYVYKILAEIWHNPTANASPSHSFPGAIRATSAICPGRVRQQPPTICDAARNHSAAPRQTR